MHENETTTTESYIRLPEPCDTEYIKQILANSEKVTVISATEYVDAIKDVCRAIDLPDHNYVLEPWPSHIYFEDVSAQSQFGMVEIIIQTVRDHGALDAPLPSSTLAVRSG